MHEKLADMDFIAVTVANHMQRNQKLAILVRLKKIHDQLASATL